MKDEFDFTEAFSRNIGIISEYEQTLLRQKKVAIAGMGGVGGIYLLTCCRLGIENFHIAEFDLFEIGNFNRQIGATVSSVGKEKIMILKNMAEDINPNVKITLFSGGVKEDNVEDFLKGVDLYLDGIDIFCMPARKIVFKWCEKFKIPAVTAAPLGLGFAQMSFLPEKMSFEKYFNFDENDSSTDTLKFIMGLSPKRMAFKYMVDLSRINLSQKRGPSNIIACQLCAGAAVGEGLKILLNRGKVHCAPYCLQYDSFLNKFYKSYVFMGNKNIFQKIKIGLAKKTLEKNPSSINPYQKIISSNSIIQILDLAKWAPSGHNEQNWAYEDITSDRCRLVVKPLGLPAEPKETSRLMSFQAGILLQTLELAASYYSFEMNWKLIIKSEKENQFELCFVELPNHTPHVLSSYIRTRFTDRRPYKLTKIDQKIYDELLKSVGSEYDLVFTKKIKEKWKFTKLDSDALKIELLHPDFMRELIGPLKINDKFPVEGLPVESLNFDWASKLLTKVLLKKPMLFRYFNTKLFGYMIPLIELSIIPFMFSAAHFTLKRKDKDISVDKTQQYIQDGMALQRFWLCCAKNNIALQPSYMQIHFSRSIESGFFKNNFEGNYSLIERLAQDFISYHNASANDILFTGRIGRPKNHSVYSRSLRKNIIDNH